MNKITTRGIPKYKNSNNEEVQFLTETITECITHSDGQRLNIILNNFNNELEQVGGSLIQINKI